MKTTILSLIVLSTSTYAEEPRPQDQASPNYVLPQDRYPKGPAIPKSRLDVKVDNVVVESNLRGRTKSSSFAVPSTYFDFRTVDNCTYPLEVVLLQDISDSFTNDMPAMINTELPAMYDILSSTHPGSTFGVVSFSDKPIEPFGWPHQDGYRDDWCYKLEGPLGLDLHGLQSIYDGFILGGGYDYPENQYGVMYSAVQAKKIGWGSTPSATRLVVLSTDSPPHYDEDNSTDSARAGMSRFSGQFDEENIDGQCVSEYYPSWQQTIAELMVPTDDSIGPYVAFLIWDDSDNNMTTATYQWFASQINENDSFVGSRGQNSTLFWETLSGIIGIIDSLECTGEVTTTSTYITSGTTRVSTSPPPPFPSSVSTTAACSCPDCEDPDCGECKEVYVKAPCDAKEIHVDVSYE